MLLTVKQFHYRFPVRIIIDDIEAAIVLLDIEQRRERRPDSIEKNNPVGSAVRHHEHLFPPVPCHDAVNDRHDAALQIEEIFPAGDAVIDDVGESHLPLLGVLLHDLHPGHPFPYPDIEFPQVGLPDRFDTHVGAEYFRPPSAAIRHILPNIFSALLVQATVSIPAAIIAEAILSFLGLGVQPPIPSWGTMLNTAQQFLETAPWMAWWPGLAIFFLALSFNLAGDGLRDFLDPKDY